MFVVNCIFLKRFTHILETQLHVAFFSLKRRCEVKSRLFTKLSVHFMSLAERSISLFEKNHVNMITTVFKNGYTEICCLIDSCKFKDILCHINF